MSIFISTGSNLGERQKNLIEAKNLLCQYLKLIAESRIYESPAVDYLNQPNFYNQVLEFHLPSIKPEEVMELLHDIERRLGRIRNIPKGPRTIDLDIIFWDSLKFDSQILTLPHPRAFERSFVILPLSELPGFKKLSAFFEFSFSFSNTAKPIS